MLYQLVSADDRHHAQRLDAISFRIERRYGSVIAKDHVGVDFSVEIFDTCVVAGYCVFERSLALGVLATATASVVAGAALLTVAVNVHVR